MYTPMKNDGQLGYPTPKGSAEAFGTNLRSAQKNRHQSSYMDMADDLNLVLELQDSGGK